MMMYLFNMFGNYSPLLLIFISFYLLRKKRNLFFYYTIGIFLNALLNLVLKGMIQMPRPSENIKEFNLALKNGSRFVFKNGIPHDIFGMPSGHTQSVMFSTIFIFLALKNYKILYLYLFISLVTMYQRIYYNYHTLLQVIVGAIVGFIFGYTMFYFCKKNIMGLIRVKKDDDGPI